MTHRLERILRILSLLQSGAPFNALQLAQETNVHRRTVFRDVALLRGAGIPIRFDPETACYSLVALPEFLAEGIRSPDLLRMLQAAALGNFILRGNADLIGRTIQHLAASLPTTDRSEVEHFLRYCRLPLYSEASASSEGYDHEVVALLLRAIRLGQQVDLTLVDGGRELRTIRVGAVQLTFAAPGAIVSGQLVPEGRTIELALVSIREAALAEAPVDFRRHEAPPPITMSIPHTKPEST
ncbi:HTH domain protein [Anatilimnocola aggregata]|uniref:HTH domain protein n=1 Tax=Anatilimnocola aggregata TaxID=2528021 RepID=A0A517Y9P0_9BACT|nr:HTH domain-containing protein [Anatilimnocola aggregata]QDU26950.1 HTH domain protein [Anatilimnocola aggregata]